MALSRDRYLAHIAEESARLLSTDPTVVNQPIPHIDGWTVGDVIGHTGWVARYVTLLQTADAEDAPPRSAVPNPPAGPDVLAWTAEALDDLAVALADSDPDATRPSFAGAVPARWWSRRMAQELSMHRWDVTAASGSPDPIPHDIAVDGIDEVFEVFVPTRMRFDTLGGDGTTTLHLHSTAEGEGGGEWTATLHPDRVEWEHSHQKGDVALRGDPSDLLLVLWSRLPASRVEIFGDSAIIDRWQAAASF